MKINREILIDLEAKLFDARADVGKGIYTESWLDTRLKKSMMRLIDSLIKTTTDILERDRNVES